MSANLIETTINISSTDLAYILEFAKVAANNLRAELRNKLINIDLDAKALDGIVEIAREERSKLWK